jgi:DDE superfamily endonuclease
VTAPTKSLQARARAPPRVRQARQDYRQRRAALDRRRVQCADDSGVNLALTRRYGRAPAGERGVGSVPQHAGPRVTRLGAVSIRGLQAVLTVDGATGAGVCRTDVTPVLGPTLPPGDLGVMANVQAHTAVGVQQALARRGARRRYVPPDSPDLSPLEPCWSTVTTALRQGKARPRAVRDAARAAAIVTVSHREAWGGFTHGGSP